MRFPKENYHSGIKTYFENVEDLQLNIYATINIFGTLQGLILAFIFLFNSNFARKSNYYLSLILIALSVLNFSGALEEMNIYESNPIWRFVPIVWYSIIPPAIYFFVKYLINPKYKFPKWGYLLFLPFIVDFLFQLIEFIRYLRGNMDLDSSFSFHYKVTGYFQFLACVFCVGVIIVLIKSILSYEKKLYQNFAEINDKSLRWLANSLGGGLFLAVLWLYMTASDFFDDAYNIPMGRVLWLGLSIQIYWIGYSVLIKRELFMNEEQRIIEDPPVELPKLSEKTEEHYQRILQIMEEEKLYHDPNLSMALLSEKIGLSKGYLSQIINQKENKNFFDFVNAYRVEEVKNKFQDADFEHFSILGIALDAGFNSKSTFNAVFKKMTGMTPSQYRKSISPNSSN